VVVPNQRILRVAEVPRSHRLLLDPLGHHYLELVFDAGAEEKTNQSPFFVLRSVAVCRAIRHTAAKQRAQPRRRDRIAARVCAADVCAERAAEALRVVTEIE